MERPSGWITCSGGSAQEICECVYVVAGTSAEREDGGLIGFVMGRNSTEYCTLTELDADVAVWPSIEASRFSHLSKEEAIERNQTFCSEATCFMQSELLSVISTGEFQGNNATQADVIAVINDVCPDLNVTSSFPFLQLGSMYPFDDEKKISSTGVTSTSTRGADGITDLTTANSTDTSGSSPGMPAPASLLLHLICFVAVAGVSLML